MSSIFSERKAAFGIVRAIGLVTYLRPSVMTAVFPIINVSSPWLSHDIGGLIQDTATAQAAAMLGTGYHRSSEVPALVVAFGESRGYLPNGTMLSRARVLL